MANVATSIENQIIKLRNRGMILDFKEAKIKEILLDVGYYRLGFYWHHFEIDNQHNFNEGTKFSDVIELYYLDVDLRYILIRHINRLELNFRTNLIYWASMHYDKDPTWYANPKIMLPDYLKDIKAHYNKNFIGKNIQIKRHHLKYPGHKFAPCWKTFEYYTFGSIAKIYENINNQDLRKKISLRYDIKKPAIFQNYLDTLVFIRNSCAHSGVIYDLHIDKGIKSLPKVKFNNNYSHNLDAAIKVLAYLMDTISTNRNNDLKEAINELFNKHINNAVVNGIIQAKLGYQYNVGADEAKT